MNWKETIELIGPNSLLEIPSRQMYDLHEERFSIDGLTREVFDQLWPLLEQQVWSVYQLWCLAKEAGEGAHILEIGSGKGGSLVTMALANPRAQFTNIDPFSPYDETSAHGTVKDYQGFTYEAFRENIGKYSGVSERVTTLPYPSGSVEAYGQIDDGSQDLIFIDGNHTYENALEDIAIYRKKVHPETGILCGHDYHPRFPGVIRAVKESFGVDFEVQDNSSIWVAT